MAKQEIKVDGNDVQVREDTAKKFRGVHWAVIVIGLMIAIIAVLAAGNFFYASRDGKVASPVDNKKTAPERQ